MLDFAQNYAKELVSLVVPFITWLPNASQRRNSKLITGTRHEFTFLVAEPLHDPATGNVLRQFQTVVTRSHMVQNVGLRAAKNVEIVFNWRPKCVNVWPIRSFEEKIAPDNRYSMIFPGLAPKELIGVEILDINRDLPIFGGVRSDECVATEVGMQPQRVWPTWFLRLVTFFLWTGMAATVYLVILGIQLLVLRTPI